MADNLMTEKKGMEWSKLRLRGGGDATDDELMQEEARAAGDDDEEFVEVVIQNLCFGRNEELHMTLDLQAPISEIKKEIYMKYPSWVCPADQMELIWRGRELSGVNHETLQQHGLKCEEGETQIRIILRQKFLAADAMADQRMRKAASDFPSMMMPGAQDSKVIMELLKSNPQLQAMWNSNPQIRQMLSNPENLRQILPQLANAGLIPDQEDMMNMLGQDEDMNSMMQPDFGYEDEEQKRSKIASQEEIMELAKMDAAELKEKLSFRSESFKRAVMEARENLFEATEGWDRKTFRESLRTNATLARQYAQLYTERGSLEEVRKALISNRTLALQYVHLSTLLNCKRNVSAAVQPRLEQGGSTRSSAEAHRGLPLEQRGLSPAGLVAGDGNAKGITFGSLQAALEQANQELKRPAATSGSKRSLDEISAQTAEEGKNSKRAGEEDEGLKVDFGEQRFQINELARKEESLLRMLRGARRIVKVLKETGEVLAARRRVRECFMLLRGLSEAACLRELRRLSDLVSSFEPLEASDRAVLSEIGSFLQSRPIADDADEVEEVEGEQGPNDMMEEEEEQRKRERNWAECRTWLEIMIFNHEFSKQIRTLHQEDGSDCPQLLINYARMNGTEMRRQLEEDDLPYEEMEQAYKEEMEEEEGGDGEEEAAAVDPREKYSSQLLQLIEMGFEDEEANLLALIDTGGSVENAITKLVS
ncbi:hypothetical protein GUITHDRAFT_115658 [Guillardia theta CCMP2712]|uniref:UBA domain-containing protein n=1 Tax=Guillardia theta (strain CCMP2712) TaxID=905079 RepID=L1IQE1_GUITC|nr:hypothetical protein GUITHDRAFT_115658 [Guillardia theta CCMP2712]EKX38104.1 hypothetical protein GUITHDRAFT_115658 [Guillardia theta CCMP2712]|eukprot:XP_005825084.1 hypothetical protein GUITHDRAFT_115658 [Guillardia theta CCMP2712]